MSETNQPFPHLTKRPGVFGPLGFLIGQLITCGITVAAVYLAAQQSFMQEKQHTQYDDATRTIQMLHVIRAELEDNFNRVEAFADYVDTLGETETVDSGRAYDLAHRAFDNAPQNDRYYLLSADAIVALNTFYDEAEKLVANIRVAETESVESVEPEPEPGNPGRGRGRGRSSAKWLSKETVQTRLVGLRDWIGHIRKTLMPRLQRQIDELEAVRREAYGADVTPVQSTDLLVLPPLPEPETTTITTPGDGSDSTGGGPGNSGTGNTGNGNSGNAGGSNGNSGNGSNGNPGNGRGRDR